jgi:transcriptional regulator with XRE-family HTH domain
MQAGAPTEMKIDEQRKALVLLRQSVGLTQEDLAVKSGIGRSKISLFESGVIDLSDLELARIEKILNKLASKSKGLKFKLADLLGPFPIPAQSPLADEGETEDISLRKLRRLQVGMSQHELAKKAGLSQTKISAWESGRRELSAAEQVQWERALFESDPHPKLEATHKFAVKLYAENENLKKQDAISRRMIGLLEELVRNQKEIIEAYEQRETTVADYKKRNAELCDLLNIETKAALKREQVQDAVRAAEHSEAAE